MFSGLIFPSLSLRFSSGDRNLGRFSFNSASVLFYYGLILFSPACFSFFFLFLGSFSLRFPCDPMRFHVLSLRYPCASPAGVGIEVNLVIILRRCCLIWIGFVFLLVFSCLWLFLGPFPALPQRSPALPCAIPSLSLRSPADPYFWPSFRFEFLHRKN